MLGDFKRVNLFLTLAQDFGTRFRERFAPRRSAHGRNARPPTPLQYKRRAPRSAPFNIYRYIEAQCDQAALFHAFEMRCGKQHYFACLAFFVLSPFFELIAAFTAPINAGATDTATMPKTMTSKWSCTNGMPPKK